MDWDTGALFAVVGVMGLNQLVMRVGALQAHPAVFWPLQLINIAVGAGLIWWGLPGLSHLPIVSFLVALLFFFRTVQNNNLRATYLREQSKVDRREREKAVRRALEASRGGVPEDDPP